MKSTSGRDNSVLEKFEMLNVLSEITRSDEHIMPESLRRGLEHFIDTCMDYRVDEQGVKHFITATVESNEKSTESQITVSALTGLRPHVVNTFIRRALIERYTELAKEQERQ
ncbi:hypothetical protein ABRZ79_04830 [Vibrio vulnificus]|uniref:hypothetical protein n=1 Tax=Vibrio TaxID=662 RepID=UPI002360DCBF|nr:hypothetical protein [Vibrio parahaemolyticus]HDY7968047.1 hypothetical protein [Vibrio vulnificus]